MIIERFVHNGEAFYFVDNKVIRRYKTFWTTTGKYYPDLDTAFAAIENENTPYQTLEDIEK